MGQAGAENEKELANLQDGQTHGIRRGLSIRQNTHNPAEKKFPAADKAVPENRKTPTSGPKDYISPSGKPVVKNWADQALRQPQNKRKVHNTNRGKKSKGGRQK